MIEYEGKPLEELNMSEAIEFEKQMLKRVLSASKSNMGDGLVEQINLFIELIRDHKRQISQSEAYAKNEKEDGSVLDIGEITGPPPAKSIEEILDFYKEK